MTMSRTASLPWNWRMGVENTAFLEPLGSGPGPQASFGRGTPPHNSPEMVLSPLHPTPRLPPDPGYYHTDQKTWQRPRVSEEKDRVPRPELKQPAKSRRGAPGLSGNSGNEKQKMRDLLNYTTGSD
ncbi:hypothetical protein U0070_003481 [Myodes glareolus]|uniref:Uncharacterized protein n=1 Tax=Myodes glareolus TaxID=447135 RepID=A0AAW0JUT2_MYOGA